ncbi:NAD-dependent epimerase/dehydratase family protein [Enterobacter huaxiensis]|uniref:NAD-dependent epimerase/dehydratase family protein n=1 Tax=Enterobacter huaxiensis TaxID=2494702 RepID=UPI00217606A1|nr:NAD-dependent epimerase/dehydratase family protein [Enterobacter huaxiensis]MCS5452511.1 NAD-dependent epimerase/dehydratase family protein [Enterobacter huaxiensis]
MLNKTVLITGAGGAIGAHMLAKILKDTDWKVIATDSFRHKGEFDRISQILGEFDGLKNRLKIITHDLCAPFTDREVNKMGKIDYVINLASLSDVQDSIDNPAPFVINNMQIIVNMLELARKVKPSAFIQFSTDEVYGPDSSKGHGHPEWDIICPSNPYAGSKAAQEAIAIAYWRSYGVPVVITNTMNNFGEMQGVSKFPAMVQKKVANGEKVTIHTSSKGEVGSRFYIHSENTADAVLFILQNTIPWSHKPGELDRPDRYNLVGDAQLSNLEMAQAIADEMGVDLDYELVNFHDSNPGHDLHYGLLGGKLKSMGWVPPMTFKESLARNIQWQKENPEWMA